MVYKAVNNQASIFLTVLFNRVSFVASTLIRNSELNVRPTTAKNKTWAKLFCIRGGALLGIRYLMTEKKLIVPNHLR